MIPHRLPITTKIRLPSSTAAKAVPSVHPAAMVPPVKKALRLMHHPIQTAAVAQKPFRSLAGTGDVAKSLAFAVAVFSFIL